MKNSTKRIKRSAKVVHIKRGKLLKLILMTFVVISVLCLGVAYYFGSKAYREYNGEEVRVVIPNGATAEEVKQILVNELGEFGDDVAMFWVLRDGSPRRAVGSYRIMPGDRVWSVVNRIRVGAQTPIKVTFNQIRTMNELAESVAKRMTFSSGDFIAACDEILPTKGFSKEQYPAAFIPDTYEFYATASPTDFVNKLVDYRDSFWNEERREKAKKIGLKPVEVATLASIVEEETIKTDERPLVARLYLNRLAQGMSLQADPTVKFAIGDFTIRRINGKMLQVQSPYNTYINKGLPPGPIRIVEASSIDAVLNAPKHDYIYMCACEDFSGYHNFTASYAEHLKNAERYRAELNARNIK